MALLAENFFIVFELAGFSGLIPIGAAVLNRNALHGFNESFQVDSVHDNNAVLKDTNPLAHLEARARS